MLLKRKNRNVFAIVAKSLGIYTSNGASLAASCIRTTLDSVISRNETDQFLPLKSSEPPDTNRRSLLARCGE
jgi:hypothetical protein